MQYVTNHFLLLRCEFWWFAFCKFYSHNAKGPYIDSIFISTCASLYKLGSHPAYGSDDRPAALFARFKLA